MDSFNNIKVEKANAIMKHRQLQKMAKLFTIIKISVILVLVSRFSSGLPFAVKNLTVFLVSPCFIFILGNVIVAILFAKSGQFSAQDSARKDSIHDLYEEFIDKKENTQNRYRHDVAYREKQSIYIEQVVSDVAHTSWQTKSYRRSQLENLKRVNCDKSCPESGTEKNGSGDRLVKNSYPENEMSNEEFRRTVEDFIAKQQKFRMEEEYSVI